MAIVAIYVHSERRIKEELLLHAKYSKESNRTQRVKPWRDSAHNVNSAGNQGSGKNGGKKTFLILML